MLPLPDFFDPQSYQASTEGGEVVIVSCLVAIVASVYVSILAYRSALKSQSSAFLWCGHFALAYTFWNLFFLSHFAQRDLEIFSTTVGTDFTQKAYLAVGVLLPSVAHATIKRIYQARYLVTNRLHILNWLLAIFIFLIPQGISMFYVTALYAFFSFGGLTLINWKIWRRYHRAQDLRLKTRSLFLGIGMSVSLFLSLVGQARAEFFPALQLPYLGNITTVIFLFFIYKMIANPRLREIRELMIRGARIIVLALILSTILILLLVWVGDRKAELFFFNIFLASFIILSVLDPLEQAIDRFILKKISLDRFELQKIIQSTIRRLKRSRTTKQLSHQLLNSIRDSKRIYQTALYLYDKSSESFRADPKSNLPCDNQLTMEHELVQYFSQNKRRILYETAEDSSEYRLLREMNAHLVFGFYRDSQLMGLWLIRSSLSADSAYSSFSQSEVQSLSRIVGEFSGMLDQLNYFEKHDQQQRLAALGEMSAALAHEIRNPLGAIQGATQLLDTSPHLQHEEDRECVQILKSEIERLQLTVEQYLHFARRNKTEEEVLLRDILNRSVETAQGKAQKTGTQIEVNGSETSFKIKTDALKLEQVLVNLLVNACEAFATKVSLSWRREGPRLVISVKDNGPGIPAAVLPNIFTPLFTTKRAGSGLGLPICKKIIDSLGGELRVWSEKDQGTEFRISFPEKVLVIEKAVEALDSPV